VENEIVTTHEPICKTDAHGNKYWYLNGKLHRTDGPAVERINGTKRWYLNDKEVAMEDVFTDPKDQFWWRLTK